MPGAAALCMAVTRENQFVRCTAISAEPQQGGEWTQQTFKWPANMNFKRMTLQKCCCCKVRTACIVFGIVGVLSGLLGRSYFCSFSLEMANKTFTWITDITIWVVWTTRSDFYHSTREIVNLATQVVRVHLHLVSNFPLTEQQNKPTVKIGGGLQRNWYGHK